MINNIAPDKWKHFFVGIFLGGALEIVTWYFFPSRPLLYTALALFILISGCYGFELFSKITGWGHYEMMDVLAGVLGGIPGIGIVLAFLLYL